jgi:hypothetical protein
MTDFAFLCFALFEKVFYQRTGALFFLVCTLE